MLPASLRWNTVLQCSRDFSRCELRASGVFACRQLWLARVSGGDGHRLRQDLQSDAFTRLWAVGAVAVRVHQYLLAAVERHLEPSH